MDHFSVAEVDQFYIAVNNSPERINPHDKLHTLRNVPKVISAQDDDALQEVRQVYSRCCDTLVEVSNIKTAEAVKILENTQRDINIAIMNEFSVIMHGIGIQTHEVIRAAQTKWNFIPFKPGFVGGHCISIDSLYLAFKAKRLGINPDLILTARKVNDNMTQFIIEQLNNLLSRKGFKLDHGRIGIFGVTYKEDSKDTRNSLALKLIKELKAAGFKLQINDPIVDKNIMKHKYDLDLLDWDDMEPISAALIIVGHEFYAQQGLDEFCRRCDAHALIMDVPNLFVDEADSIPKGIHYWSL